jgi:hypothetical protein
MMQFENRMLKRIFVPEGDDMTAGWRKLHNEEFHSLNSSPNTIRMIKPRRVRWVGHVARMGNMKNVNILVGKPEGKRSLGRPRRRLKDNIKMDLGKENSEVWIGFIWLTMGTGGGLL